MIISVKSISPAYKASKTDALADGTFELIVSFEFDGLASAILLLGTSLCT